MIGTGIEHKKHPHMTLQAIYLGFVLLEFFWSSPVISRDPSEKRIDRSKNARMSVWDNGISIEWCGMNSIGMEWYDMEWFGLVWFFVLSALELELVVAFCVFYSLI